VGVCVWLAKLVRMRRPDQDAVRPEGVSLTVETAPKRPSTKKVSSTAKKFSSNSSDLLQQRSSRSLLANVLDLEDDFLLFNITGAAGTMGLRQSRIVRSDSARAPQHQQPILPDCTLDQPKDDGAEVKVDPQRRVKVCPVRSNSQRSAAGGHGVNGSAGSCAADFRRPVLSAWKATGNGSSPQPLSVDLPGLAAQVPVTPLDAECSLLSEVLAEVQYMTGRVRRDAEMQQVCSDWKFAAMVIDRVCLWMFSFFTVVSTGAILLSAPNMIG